MQLNTIEGLHSHYVLNFKDSSNTMSKIFSKTFDMWEDKVYSSINSHYLDLYYEANNLTELEKESITSDDLIVGYIDNMPFEGKIHRNFTGITNQYLEAFSDMTGATYKFVSYKIQIK